MNKMNKKDKLLLMSQKECQQYMYDTYPIFFQEKDLDMMQTCMVWGCCIGVGWFPILDEACQQLKLIQQVTGIIVIFEQIKEKFGSGRFYYRIDYSKHILPNDTNIRQWCNMIDSIISNAERQTEHTCAECGEQFYHSPISYGGWVYDICDKCFLKVYPDRKESFEKYQKRIDFNEKFRYSSNSFTDEERQEIEKILNNVEKRIKEKYEKR